MSSNNSHGAHVSLSELRQYDDATVAALRNWYANWSTTSTKSMSIADLGNWLQSRQSTSLLTLETPVKFDTSSMYTVTNTLYHSIPWKEVALVNDLDSTTPTRADALRLLLESEGREGLWLWLAHELLLRNIGKSSQVSEDTKETDARNIATWVWEPGNSQRWYRHRIAGPLCVWEWRQRVAGDASTSLTDVLSNSPLATGEIYEQIASRPEILTSGALITANSSIGQKNFTAGKGLGSSRYRGAQAQQASVLLDLSTGAGGAIVFP